MRIESILETFYAEHAWLFSLVTDPQGKRFFQAKTQKTYLAQFEEALARTADFLTFAGHPERAFRALHIAGTSGKGSVTLMAAALLRAAGQRTGHHTSPYLQTPTEKLVCDGRPIRPSDFIQLVRDFRALHTRWVAHSPAFHQLRYGEAWVALTFMWLAQCRLDWAVIETGMGGRYDSTNLVPAELALITNVDWDHARPLGPSLTDIAWHKAGIIKAGKPAVTGVTQPELLEVVTHAAQEKGSSLYVLGRDFDYTIHDAHTVTVRTPLHAYPRLRVGSGGRYQLGNAALALTAVDLLAAAHDFTFNHEIAQAALADLTYPGRMEIVSHTPLVILDGAHNPHKMAALVDSVQAAYPDKRITAVVGAIVNKDAAHMLASLVPAVVSIVATQPHVPGKPAVPPADLVEMVGTLDADLPVTSVENVRTALEALLPTAAADDLILITGSLYLVGEAREYWYPTRELLRASELSQM